VLRHRAQALFEERQQERLLRRTQLLENLRLRSLSRERRFARRYAPVVDTFDSSDNEGDTQDRPSGSEPRTDDSARASMTLPTLDDLFGMPDRRPIAPPPFLFAPDRAEPLVPASLARPLARGDSDGQQIFRPPSPPYMPSSPHPWQRVDSPPHRSEYMPRSPSYSPSSPAYAPASPRRSSPPPPEAAPVRLIRPAPPFNGLPHPRRTSSQGSAGATSATGDGEAHAPRRFPPPPMFRLMSSLFDPPPPPLRPFSPSGPGDRLHDADPFADWPTAPTRRERSPPPLAPPPEVREANSFWRVGDAGDEAAHPHRRRRVDPAPTAGDAPPPAPAPADGTAI